MRGQHFVVWSHYTALKGKLENQHNNNNINIYIYINIIIKSLQKAFRNPTVIYKEHLNARGDIYCSRMIKYYKCTNFLKLISNYN